MPKEGDILKTEIFSLNLKVIRKIGEGTQGKVFLVHSPHGEYALKWYRPEQATSEQKESIRQLLLNGPPRGDAGSRFIWPIDLVTRNDSDEFGYLMPLIDTKIYATLNEIWGHKKPLPDFVSMCEISFQLANSYRALHLSGYCYRDISAGNLMFNPHNGNILICDNDNVGVNRQSGCQIWGTMEYMAPEVVIGKAMPSIETDLHSLAVLLFYLWIWHHPMHGMMEYRYHCWDLPSKKMVYGKEPVFIFDPVDQRNQLPKDPAYLIAKKRWEYCPTSLKKLFTRAFTEGLKKPTKRVTEGEWQRLFLNLKDNAVKCDKCKAWNLREPEYEPEPKCWHCGEKISSPPTLILTHPAGKRYITLRNGLSLYFSHIKPSTSKPDYNEEIGLVVKNPKDQEVYGIKNTSNCEWEVTFGGKERIIVPPGKAVPLNPKMMLFIEDTKIELLGR